MGEVVLHWHCAYHEKDVAECSHCYHVELQAFPLAYGSLFVSKDNSYYTKARIGRGF